MDKIALWGGSGSLGKTLTSALLAKGLGCRIVGRSQSSLEQTFGKVSGVEFQVWNPDDPASIRQAAEGVGTIIYMVGVPYWEFRLHPELMRKTLDGAIAAGVKRLMLIGTLYPFGRPRTARVAEDHPREPHTFKGKMRREQEDIVLAAHAAGKIQTSILRLPDFYGPGVDKSFLWSAFQAAKKGGRAQLIGPIDMPHEFVYLPDAGRTAVDLITHPGAWGTTWNLGGVGVTTMRTMMEEIFRQAGRKPKYVTIGKPMLRVAGLFDRTVRELVEMHYLLTTPVIVDDAKLAALLGDLHKTSYEEGIRRTLDAI
jgi:nucleoside-diphosphate-sugar epimerase